MYSYKKSVVESVYAMYDSNKTDYRILILTAHGFITGRVSPMQTLDSIKKHRRDCRTKNFSFGRSY